LGGFAVIASNGRLTLTLPALFGAVLLGTDESAKASTDSYAVASGRIQDTAGVMANPGMAAIRVQAVAGNR
jgi:hypothetical protein